MAALVTFGICLAISIVLLILLALLMGPGFFMVILILPVVLSEGITGETGTFNPNGSGKKSPLFNLLMAFFTITQVLLVAGLFFGIYVLIAGFPIASKEVITSSREVLSPLQIYRLQTVNLLLWLLTGTFICMWIFNIIRFGEHIKKMAPSSIFWAYILPLLTYPFAFLFLVTTHKYLAEYPNGDQHIGFFSKAAGVIYIIYLFASQIHALITYVTVLRRHNAQLGFQYWFSLGASLFYKVVFIYFVVCILMSL